MSSPGVVPRRLQRVIYLNILLVFDIVLSSCEPVAKAATIEPTQEVLVPIAVTSNSGIQITTAIAKILGTSIVDSLENDNQLLLRRCFNPEQISIWAPGHYIRTILCDGSTAYSVMLDKLENDNTNYSWASAQTCSGCHSEAQGRTEYSEWTYDRHSRVFLDPYFWTVYLGTDIFRNPGTETSWTILQNGQKSRSPSNSTYGPGFRLDYPNENGNCAYCHAPAAVRAIEQGLDLRTWNNSVPGSRINAETEGISCDICHKVTDVLIGENRLPFAERPGILSFLFIRPGLNQLFHVGPLADQKPENAEIKSTCSQVFSESRFCAACHYGKFFDTVIYNSYGEWLESSYSNKETSNYRSCQDCHMPSAQGVGNTLPEERAACSQANHSFRNFNHNTMARDNYDIPTRIKGAATIELTARIEDGRINVAVSVRSIDVGHKFPTDSPLRHLILLVEAKDRNNVSLAQVDGSVIPPWGGVGILPEDYAGRPGEIYANILKDKDTSLTPTIAYWNPTIPAWGGSDTRLNPGVASESQYSFAAPSNGRATITARLIYRYAFIDIIRQKKWPLNDILVTETTPLPIP